MTHLTRSMALDLAADGIRVNAVCPGSVRTPMFDAAIARLDAAKVEDTFCSQLIPMGRIAELREVAAVIAFLSVLARRLLRHRRQSAGRWRPHRPLTARRALTVP